MKMQSRVEKFENVGFVCDACMSPVFFEDNDMQASLSAKFGPGSEEDGNEYHLDLCESCFKEALSEMKIIRRNEFMFDEKNNDDVRYPDKFGLVRESGKADIPRTRIVEGIHLTSAQKEDD
ncbi:MULTISPECIES: hypothetical protein [unclassified Oleiphilus]|uniref:hypothetical protein n=1 Tax=unclassified Oleiphilus TaxID=2631174 RepID=UPI000B25A181|nr:MULTISPECIES: hypothetical protein [unclassified Oleiphilus]